jgi:hypothetical protein
MRIFSHAHHLEFTAGSRLLAKVPADWIFIPFANLIEKTQGEDVRCTPMGC